MTKIHIRKKRTFQDSKDIFNDEKKQLTFDEILGIAKQSYKDNKKLMDVLAKDD